MRPELQALFKSSGEGLKKLMQAQNFQQGHVARLLELKGRKCKHAEEALSAANRKIEELQRTVRRLQEDKDGLRAELDRARTQRRFGGAPLSSDDNHHYNPFRPQSDVGGAGDFDDASTDFVGRRRRRPPPPATPPRGHRRPRPSPCHGAAVDRAESTYNVLDLMVGGAGGQGQASPTFGGAPVNVFRTKMTRLDPGAESGVGLGLELGGSSTVRGEARRESVRPPSTERQFHGHHHQQQQQQQQLGLVARNVVGRTLTLERNENLRTGQFGWHR